MKAFGFVVVKDNYQDSGKMMKVGVISDFITTDMIKSKIERIKLYDNNFEWFRPIGLTHIELEETTIEGEHKFIRFEMNASKRQFVIVFSKFINHNDMSDFIHAIVYKSKFGFCSPVSAGFCSGEKYYGKSETLLIDSNGQKF